jgi:lysophospholipase L1-like esterase
MSRCVRALLIAAAWVALAPHASADGIPLRLHLAGDSTLSDKLPEKRPETGWGEAMAGLFEPGSVLVINHARNGRSTRTFIEEGRWAALLKSAAPGDHVFLQFGHNDASENKPDRYTPLPDYRGNLQRFVREARAAGLQPLLLTPVARRRFDEEGHPQPSHGAYPDAVRALALELDVPMIDAERLSEALLKRAGPDASKHLFLHLPADAHPNYPGGLQDDTHFSAAGATAVAHEIAEALRARAHPLARHLPEPRQ